MKWFTRVFFALFLAFGAQTASAGSGHYHGPVTEAQAGQIAQNIVRNLTTKGSLSSNAAETAPERRKLNVFLTLTGGFIKADFAGK